MYYGACTHPHIGDNIICTGAVRNVRLEHPDIMFVYPDACKEICYNNPDYAESPSYRPIGKITYGSLEEEKHASRGTVIEAYTRSLCSLIGIPMVPVRVNHPVLVLSDAEKEESRQWNGCVLINANCQTCSMSKGYPWWQEVVHGLEGMRIVQVGGNEARDLSPDLSGVEDMRGKTTLRQLITMVYGCSLVLSPPSCISNIAGAFSKEQVIVNASREPDLLLGYENALHASHVCSACGWGVTTGCVCCRIGVGNRACIHSVNEGGRQWCLCQHETKPEEVLEKAVTLLLGRI